LRLRWASIGIQEIKDANRKNDKFVVLKACCQDSVYVHPIYKEKIFNSQYIEIIFFFKSLAQTWFSGTATTNHFMN